MNCGNCGKKNEYGAKVCSHCGSTLALTEYFRASGFVEKKAPKADPEPETKPEPKPEPKPQKEPWDQDILTAGTKKRNRYNEAEANGQKNKAAEQKPTEKKSVDKNPAEKAPAPRQKNTPNKSTPSKNSPQKNHSTNGKNDAGKAKTVPSVKEDRQQGQRRTPKEEKNPPELQVIKEVVSEETPIVPTPKKSKKKTEDSKRAPTSKAYNRTTKTLSLAEKEVLKKTEKKQPRTKKWLLPLVFAVALILGAAIYVIATVQLAPNEDDYREMAETFAKAMVMRDDKTVSRCIHPRLYGSLRTLDYKNVERCETKSYTIEKQPIGNWEDELRESYGITDSIDELYRVAVGCTIHEERSYTRSMVVLIAQIDKELCIVKVDMETDLAGNP